MPVMASAGRKTTGLKPETAQDMFVRLGSIPLSRIRMQPPPGLATEEDVLSARRSPEKLLCELVDGVLVEKVVSTREGYLSGRLLRSLGDFADEHDLGIVLPGDSLMRLRPGLIRAPDVSFIPWSRLPGDDLPDEAIASVVPTLAVEVLSPNNTVGEIDRKRSEYFRAGCRLVWVIDPAARTAVVWTSRTRCSEMDTTGVLEGRRVLPGFRLPLSEVFAPLRKKRRR